VNVKLKSTDGLGALGRAEASPRRPWCCSRARIVSEAALYDTMTRAKQPLVPLEPPTVRIYSCGPRSTAASTWATCAPTCSRIS
jgi:hypothetical protein